MKKLFFFLLVTTTINVFGQNDKYMQAMSLRVAAFDTVRTPEGYADLANAFERIANAEKTQWLPYYYAALSNVMRGLMSTAGTMGGNNSKLDPLADKAESLLNKADELNKNNSEIYAVKKMIATLRMMVDPMNRYMQFGPIAAQALETAKKLNPDNPRVYLLEGQDKFYTPEQFGGSKTEAKKLFELALQKYETFKPESSISPNWGRPMVQYFISQIK